MRGSHCSIAEDSSLRGCDAVSLGAFLLTFRRTLEIESIKILRNIGNHSPSDRPSLFRKLESSCLLFLSDFNQKGIWSTNLNKNPQYKTSRKYVLWVQSYSMRTGMTKLTSAFRKCFANAPKKVMHDLYSNHSLTTVLSFTHQRFF